MFNHSKQPHQDGDLFPDESIFAGRTVRPAPLPPVVEAPVRDEPAAPREAARRDAMPDAVAPESPEANTPSPRRRATERNFRRNGAVPVLRQNFTLSVFGGARAAAHKDAVGEPGSSPRACVVRRDDLPIFQAGKSALAGLEPVRPMEQSRKVMFWGLSAAAVIAAAALVAVVRHNTASAPASHVAAAPAQRDFVKRLPDMSEVVKGFFAAETPEEKAAFVRGGDQLLPAMLKYYATHPDEPGTVDDATGTPYQDESGEFIMVNARAEGRAFHFMMESGGESPRIDWRSLTGEGDMPWDQWIQERPSTPVSQRVWASLDDYYTGEFADSSRYLCLKITSPDGSTTAWAYAERTTPEARGLQKVLGTAGPESTAVMVAAGPPQRPRTRLLGDFAFPGTPGPEHALPQVSLIGLTEGGWIDRTTGTVAAR